MPHLPTEKYTKNVWLAPWTDKLATIWRRKQAWIKQHVGLTSEGDNWCRRLERSGFFLALGPQGEIPECWTEWSTRASCSWGYVRLIHWNMTIVWFKAWPQRTQQNSGYAEAWASHHEKSIQGWHSLEIFSHSKALKNHNLRAQRVSSPT